MTGARRELPLEPVGYVRTAQRLHHEAPRQSGLGRGSGGTLEVRQGLQNCLRDLDGFSHVWLLTWCHLARGWRSLVQPPRDHRKRGLFATRAPQRPNPIGLSCVRLLRIEKRVLVLGDHDLLDGTPVLDVKPYLPYCDSVPDAAIGYVATLPADRDDHVCWWQQKAVPPPRRYRERGGRGAPPRADRDA
jgi:tRNA-Thr(GGU) m(6)t(6)A37 methyltransferase TsaA